MSDACNLNFFLFPSSFRCDVQPGRLRLSSDPFLSFEDLDSISGQPIPVNLLIPLEDTGIMPVRYYNPMPAHLSSVFSCLGVEGLDGIMNAFPEVFQNASDNVQGLALLSIARAMKPFGEALAHHVHKFVDMLESPSLTLTWSAVQCLSHMMERQDLRVAMEPHIPKVLSLLSRRHAYRTPWLYCDDLDLQYDWSYSDGLLMLAGATCGLLSRCDFFEPHAEGVVRGFMLQVNEKEAEVELRRFQGCVQRKTHGAYMCFMKRCTSMTASFSLLFNSACWRSGFVQQCLDLLGDAGACQRALFLLCAARPMPTFTKTDATACASLLCPFLNHPCWQLRVCAIHSLQRLMAGCVDVRLRSHNVHIISGLLNDSWPFVRQSAATAIGCLGSKAVQYKRALLALLKDSNSHIRYASLITLGGCMAKVRPHAMEIAHHLNDTNPKCRMAALRALKCLEASP